MDEFWIWIAATLVGVNLAALLQVGWDKRCARRGLRRVPEARLILPVLAGGLPGVLIGMSLFRHKTVKRSFQLKLAAASVAWALVAAWIGRSFLLGDG